MWLIFGDLHADMYRQFATITEDGINSRLLEQINVIKQIRKLGRKNKVTAIFFLGDLFNSQSPSISKFLYNAIFYMIQTLTEVAPLYLLVGNHDVYQKIHIYTPFSSIPNVHIIEETTRLELDGRTIDMVPCYAKLPENKAEYCFGHFGIEGATIGGITNIDETIPIELLEQYKIVFAGHFHTRQQLGEDIWHTGAVMSHSFKDTTEDKGIWLVDPITDNYTFVPIRSPKFYTFVLEKEGDLEDFFSFIETADAEQYYRLIVKSDNIIIPDNIVKHMIVEYEYDNMGEDVQSIDTSDILNLVPIIQEFIDKSNTAIPKDILKKKAIELLEE